jgi:integrase
MSLTRLQIENAKPKAKSYKLFDGKGLYIEVAPTGARWWRFKYRIAGKEKRISLGVYPDVGLKDARDKLDEVRKQLASDIDPSEQRKAKKAASVQSTENTFEAVAREWFALNLPRWQSNYGDKTIRRLEANIFPWLGTRPVREVTAPELLTVLRRIESRSANDTAHRALQDCGRIFRYAIATSRADRDLSRDLAGALAPITVRHYPTIIDPKGVGALLRAIEAYTGSFVTKCALRLAALVFVRPGELRKAEWSEFDLEKAEWRIPAERMKMRSPHIVPLARQAVQTITELRPLTGDGPLLFPGEFNKQRPMSENTINSALRRLGYTREEMTGHGFRSMASTMLNEQGWNRDAIERQLAHSERDTVRAVYNYAEHLPERRRMMQAWADHLDSLRAAEPKDETKGTAK